MAKINEYILWTWYLLRVWLCQQMQEPNTELGTKMITGAQFTRVPEEGDRNNISQQYYTFGLIRVKV